MLIHFAIILCNQSPDAAVALDADVVIVEAAVSHGDPPGEYLADVLLPVILVPAQISLDDGGVPPHRTELVGFVLYRLQCFIVESRSWSCREKFS